MENIKTEIKELKTNLSFSTAIVLISIVTCSLGIVTEVKHEARQNYPKKLQLEKQKSDSLAKQLLIYKDFVNNNLTSKTPIK